MKKTVTSMVAALTAVVGLSAASQASAVGDSSKWVPQSRVYSHLTQADVDAIRTHATTTIPTFNGSFTYSGKSYNYIMVGGAPSAGGTTTIPTAIVPLKVVFTGTTNPSTGQPYTFDGSSRVTAVENSPLWKTANYSVGSGLQVQDAIQIAQFYNTKAATWHTVFGTPRVLPTVTVNVPTSYGSVKTSSGGTLTGQISIIWWEGQVTSLLKKAGVKTTEVPLVLTDNIVGYEFTTANCCIVGYHNSYTKWFVGSQAYAWSSYVESGTFTGDVLLDITAISHELAELTNDPFPVQHMNSVPSWEFPGQTNCQGNLETGDPVEVLPNPSFPVVIGTTTYHPQTEALLQWFERKVPSDAFNGAYSYPDITALTSPAKDCGT